MKKFLAEAVFEKRIFTQFFSKKLGQSSIEYLILVGLILAALIPIIYYSTGKTSSEIRTNQADQAVQTIAKAADNVYTAGPGNQEAIQIVIPSGVSSFTVNGRNIIINMTIYGATSQVLARSIATIQNTSRLQTGQGTYNMVVRMTEKQVELVPP